MAFSPAPKLQTAPSASGTGMSMSMLVSAKAKRASVRITINSEAQTRLFGRALKAGEDRVDVLIGRGQDEGRALLRLDSEGEIEVRGSMRGSVAIRMGRWDLLPESKPPSGICRDLGEPEKQGDATVVLLSLPDWASPTKRERAAMSAKARDAHGVAL